LYGGGNKGGQGFHAAVGVFDDACFSDGLRFSDTCSCDASCCDACWLEQSSYSSHMLSFAVRLNSKPMHHLLATSPTTSATASPAMLLALWHAKLQSSSVAFLPKLPLLSSWPTNQRSNSWSANFKQRPPVLGGAVLAAAGAATWADG
jgi:hypothetical protein